MRKHIRIGCVLAALVAWANWGSVAGAEGLLDHLPAGTGLVADLDLSQDNDSARALRAQFQGPDWDQFQANLLGALSRLGRLAGVDLDLQDDVLGWMNGEVALAMSDPQGTHEPTITLLATINDPQQAESSLRKLVGGLFRSDEEEVTARGDARLHQWRDEHRRARVSYLVAPDYLAIAFGPAGSATLAAGRVEPANGSLRTGLAGLPPGVFRYYLSGPALAAGAPAPAASLLAMLDGMGGSTSVTDQGRQTDMVIRFKNGATRQINSLAGLPDVSNEALNAVPAGSLAVVAVADPSALVDALTPPDGLSGLPPLLVEALALMRYPTAIAVRSVAPFSWLVSVAAPNEAAAQPLADAMQGAFGKAHSAVPVARYHDVPIYHVSLPIPGAEKALWAQSGGHVLLAADRRTLEESLDALASGAGALPASDEFGDVAGHFNQHAKVVGYLDVASAAGALMLLTPAVTLFSPVGTEMADVFANVGGLGLSLAPGDGGLRGRAFLSFPSTHLPPAVALVGAAELAAGAAVLFPAFSEARERARTAVCTSNLRQISLAMQMYAQDWGGKLPPAARWRTAIQPYLKSTRVFKCPSDTQAHPSSYAFNRNLSGHVLARVSEPSQTILLFETTASGDNPSDAGRSLAQGRHPHGDVYAFADGHVSVMAHAPSALQWGQAAGHAGPAPHRLAPVPSRRAARRPARRRRLQRRPARRRRFRRSFYRKVPATRKLR